MKPLPALPKLYSELASWWELLSPPEEYVEEAELYRQALTAACDPPPRTLLELGSGGGSNAFHLQKHFRMTLVDLSPAMLAVSRAVNPECEHLEGDMRSVRLGRLFDAVLIHDAICYMTTLDELRRAVETAFAHLRPGGAALFAPDFTREIFQPGASHGGHDGDDGRGLRYLEWVWDPDPSDSTYIADYVYALRDTDGGMTSVQDRHIEGLFSRDEWLRTLEEAGFEARLERFVHHDEDGEEVETTEGFLGRKP